MCLVLPSQPVTIASTHILANSGVLAARTSRREEAIITLMGELCTYSRHALSDTILGA